MNFPNPGILGVKGGGELERFGCKTEILSGPGALEAVGQMGIRRLLIVSDPYFYENGTAQRVGKLSNAERLEYFHQVQPDPSVALAARGTALLKEFDPDCILALGGGSAMDCAKAMAYFSESRARFIAVPTTSGSGSEVTDFAVLTHDGVKHPLVDARLRPDVAILDETLLSQLPPKLVADAGFDVLSHALEAYVAGNAGAVTDALAADAFRIAYSLLPASFAGDTRVRGRLHMAATMAGMAFSQAGLGLCHAMSHTLGGVFHIPHGRLNAILLPAVIECNAHTAGEKYARLAALAGLGAGARTVGVRNLKNSLIRLRRELGMPESLAQAGVKPEAVWHQSKALVTSVLADPCCTANPVKVEDYMVRRVLESVTGHG